MEIEKSITQVAIEEKFRIMMERSGSNVRLKNEVMSTIDRINNFATLVDLFTTKMLQTKVSVFKNRNKGFRDPN